MIKNKPPMAWCSLALLTIVLTVNGLYQVGCGTPQRAAFNAESGVTLTIDHAMQAWGSYVGQYHPPVAQELQVKAAFEKYQSAMAVAVDAARAYASLGTNAPPLLDPAFQARAADAMADLLALLRQFNIKL